MKKLLVLLVVLAMLSCFALAKNDGEQQVQKVAQTEEQQQDKNSEDSGPPLPPDFEQEDIKDNENQSEDLQEKDNETIQKQKEKPESEKNQNKTFKNENAVRDAVHALLAVENRTGGIGQQVSEIAREFNNGINKTKEAEEKVQQRGWFRRFFMGGDEQAAAILENETLKNSEMVQQLKDLIAKCNNCTDDAKQVLKEQTMVLEQEQTRLQEMAKKEKSKGLFGWILKI